MLRYFFCRALSKVHPSVEQSLECRRIDLVLRRKQRTRPPELALVEFKFYHHARRYDLWTGDRHGFKGGPGRKNLSEFLSCVNRLNGRASRSSKAPCSKYIVLLYADPETQTRKYSYGQFYDKYRHPGKRIAMEPLLHKRFQSGSDKITCNLYEVQ